MRLDTGDLPTVKWSSPFIIAIYRLAAHAKHQRPRLINNTFSASLVSPHGPFILIWIDVRDDGIKITLMKKALRRHRLQSRYFGNEGGEHKNMTGDISIDELISIVTKREQLERSNTV